MKKLAIGFSSFGNPQHSSWKSLNELYDLQFLEYGNLGSIVSKENFGHGLVYVQYLDDILLDCSGKPMVGSSNDSLEYLLSLIESRCRDSSELFLFGFSSWTPDNVIRHSKKISERKKLNIWFLNRLEEIASKNSHFYFLDLDACFSEFGLTRCFDMRNWYFARARTSSLGYEVIANSMRSILMRHENAAHKVLVVDCDNTLWGGIVGEDSVSGLELGTDGIGQAFADFQKLILKLKNEGVLIALASKNNEQDVWQVFDDHEGMVLSRSDIVAAKINWEEKSRNISEIAQELDLDLSSFVFWDDNPVEREKTKILLPSMYTVDVPSSVWEWSSLLATLDEFGKFDVTEDDREKTPQYAARQKFLSSKMGSIDESAFLQSLNLRAKLVPYGKINSTRAVQLCQKTNQFNLTTRRHTVSSLDIIAEANSHYCALASLEDRFGKHGSVGLFCLQALNDEDLYIDTFLLSCRVLGRHFELWMMAQIIDIAKTNGFERLIAEFIPTAKNKVAETFLDDCGFLRLVSTSPVGLAELVSEVSSGDLYFRNLAKLSSLDEDLYNNFS